MAGSYRHIIDEDNKFRGVDLLDHLGDAYEALQECHWMINHLCSGDKEKVFEAHRAYVAAPDGCNNPKYAETITSEDFWDE